MIPSAKPGQIIDDISVFTSLILIYYFNVINTLIELEFIYISTQSMNKKFFGISIIYCRYYHI